MGVPGRLASRKLRQPLLDEHRTRVVAQPLAYGSEMALFGVGSNPTEIPPITPVAPNVMVHKEPLEQFCTAPPVQPQVLRQQGRAVLAAPVR